MRSLYSYPDKLDMGESYGPYFNQTASSFCEPCTDKWDMAGQYNQYQPFPTGGANGITFQDHSGGPNDLY
eukprot:CAMPEP_0173385852 /NCGR_PEP_ID=MMETSP1356-20130122/8451_1 /TAXON_ID=77927 ORGANISM="Hemiselmis virescens, Strain PCC157" /NCGR_SAMPLE_ID=MMETSP1356 /ASSEMBLY_ACC=CAM_ASM_000847 /LENGTH=69 /DNA_ID=CAMNT_0014341839 /DNA_START=47 /DNA_END=256 /DNA_ORIENTATION=+